MMAAPIPPPPRYWPDRSSPSRRLRHSVGASKTLPACGVSRVPSNVSKMTSGLTPRPHPVTARPNAFLCRQEQCAVRAAMPVREWGSDMRTVAAGMQAIPAARPTGPALAVDGGALEGLSVGGREPWLAVLSSKTRLSGTAHCSLDERALSSQEYSPAGLAPGAGGGKRK